jgi:allantoin racemase
MRLLVINPFGTDAYDEKVENSVKKVVRDDTEIVTEHLERGPSFIRHAYFQSLIVPDIADRIYRAEKEGFDGVFVSCIFEPGVKEAKELVDIPVVGGSEPNVNIARHLGQKFAFFTDTPRADQITYNLFRERQIGSTCIGITSVEMGIEEIKSNPGKSSDKIIELSRQAVADGADVIINGCTVLAAFFEKENLPDDLKGIPVIDSNVGSIKALEMLVDLHQKYNLVPSRKVSYQKPEVKEKETFDRVRKTFGY